MSTRGPETVESVLGGHVGPRPLDPPEYLRLHAVPRPPGRRSFLDARVVRSRSCCLSSFHVTGGRGNGQAKLGAGKKVVDFSFFGRTSIYLRRYE